MTRGALTSRPRLYLPFVWISRGWDRRLARLVGRRYEPTRLITSNVECKGIGVLCRNARVEKGIKSKAAKNEEPIERKR
jgi:hypothetical protein